MSEREYSARSALSGRLITRRGAIQLGLAAGAGLGLTGILNACGASGQPSGSSRGGKLRIGRPSWGAGEAPDPAITLTAYEYLGALYGRLVRRGPGGVPAPDLAESWESSSKGDSWQSKLRMGVTFHNGKPFTSKDAAYTIQHILDPEVKSPARSVLGSLVDPAGIKTPDASSLVIGLKQPDSEFPRLLMHYNMYVIPDGSGITIKTSGIGTGPFKLKSFTAEHNGSVVANPNYYGGRPNLDQIDYITIADSQAQVNALLAGQIDMIYLRSGAARRPSGSVVNRRPALRARFPARCTVFAH